MCVCLGGRRGGAAGVCVCLCVVVVVVCVCSAGQCGCGCIWERLLWCVASMSTLPGGGGEQLVCWPGEGEGEVGEGGLALWPVIR